MMQCNKDEEAVIDLSYSSDEEEEQTNVVVAATCRSRNSLSIKEPPTLIDLTLESDDEEPMNLAVEPPTMAIEPLHMAIEPLHVATEPLHVAPPVVVVPPQQPQEQQQQKRSRAADIDDNDADEEEHDANCKRASPSLEMFTKTVDDSIIETPPVDDFSFPALLLDEDDATDEPLPSCFFVPLPLSPSAFQVLTDKTAAIDSLDQFLATIFAEAEEQQANDDLINEFFSTSSTSDDDFLTDFNLEQMIANIPTTLVV
jgi:hypothetical protein